VLTGGLLTVTSAIRSAYSTVADADIVRPGGSVAVNELAEEPEQLLAAAWSEPPADARFVSALQLRGAREHALARRRQRQCLRPPIRRRRHPPREPASLEIVDYRDEIGAPYSKSLADLGLRYAAVAVNDHERRELTGSQSKLRERCSEVREYRELRTAQHVSETRIQHPDGETTRHRSLVTVVRRRRGQFGS